MVACCVSMRQGTLFLRWVRIQEPKAEAKQTLTISSKLSLSHPVSRRPSPLLSQHAIGAEDRAPCLFRIFPGTVQKVRTPAAAIEF